MAEKNQVKYIASALWAITDIGNKAYESRLSLMNVTKPPTNAQKITRDILNGIVFEGYIQRERRLKNSNNWKIATNAILAATALLTVIVGAKQCAYMKNATPPKTDTTTLKSK